LAGDDLRQTRTGGPRSLRQGLFQSGPFKKYFWRKMNPDRLLDTSKQL